MTTKNKQTKQERVSEKFPKGTPVSFTLGRGHKYKGIVANVNQNSYLVVKYTDRFDQSAVHNINPENATKLRASVTA